MSDPQVTVRPAVPADADGIAEVHVTAWRETYADVIPDRFMNDEALAQRKAMWTHILAMDPLPGRVVVAQADDQIVGFAFAGPSTHPDALQGHPPVRDTHLFAIYVLADHQGRGIGHDLLEVVLGGAPAQLWVLDSNDKARAFYERHGFESDGVSTEDPDLRITEIRMRR